MHIHSTISPWFDIAATAERGAVAIADVHGRADLLEAMLGHLGQETSEEVDVVFLGDLIDRGPEGLRCLDLARAGIKGRRTRWLAGNHEEMLICATLTERPEAFGALVLWVRNGGSSVLEELGLYDMPQPDELVAALGADRLAFLRGMETHVRNGQVLFVHGGINPTRPIEPQLQVPFDSLFEMNNEDDSIRWVRRPWVGHPLPLEDGSFVIYGHTIQRPALPKVTVCQAGIDLGAYSRGVLCAAEVSGNRIRYHFVGEWDRIVALKEHYS